MLTTNIYSVGHINIQTKESLSARFMELLDTWLLDWLEDLNRVDAASSILYNVGPFLCALYDLGEVYFLEVEMSVFLQ